MCFFFCESTTLRSCFMGETDIKSCMNYDTNLIQFREETKENLYSKLYSNILTNTGFYS